MRQDPRTCWICLENEDESEGTEVGPFVDNLCVCTLQAHETCMLKWILASGKPTTNCPQCNSKFVAVKKRQTIGLILRGLKRVLAAAAFFGVSFVVFRSVGSVYIRAVYAPFDADRILGVLPISGLSSWANTVVKSINSIVVAGIPFVLLRRPRLGTPAPAQIEPPLLSLAMILMSRLDPQPTGWASLMIAGITHSIYRTTMDTFVMPLFGKTPVQVPETLLPRILNLDRLDNNGNGEFVHLPRPEEQEPISEASGRINAWVENSLVKQDFINRLLEEIVKTIIRDADGDVDDEEVRFEADIDLLLRDGVGTPNDSDATVSDDEEGDAAAVPGIQQFDFDIESMAIRQLVHLVRARHQDGVIYPVLAEDHVLSLYVLLGGGDHNNDPSDLVDWHVYYNDVMQHLVNYSRIPSATDTGSRIRNESWKLLYWLPLRLLESQPSRRRIEILLDCDPPVLDLFRALSYSDHSTWNPRMHERLLFGESSENVALYVSLWIEERRISRGLPREIMIDEDFIGEFDAVDPEIALLLRGPVRGADIPQTDNDDTLNDTAVLRALDPALEWEQAVPVLLFPHASILVSRFIKTLWPYSLLSAMNRNLVAGGLVIVANDILRIGLTTIQCWNQNAWHITRYDALNRETQQLIQLQERVGDF